MRRGPALAFGVADLLAAALLALGVFAGLPERRWLVDAPACLIVALLAIGGGGLVARARWSYALGKVAASVTLAVGLALVAALALSAAYLSGIYGPVGRGGAIIFTLVIALAIPYLVALPALQLYCLSRAAPPAANADVEKQAGGGP